MPPTTQSTEPYNLPFIDGTQDLIEPVILNNPGACRVVQELQWFNKWFDMLKWLRKNDIVGSKLWEKYKDDFHEDSHALGKWIEKTMYEERDRNNKTIPKNKRIKFHHKF